MLTDRHTNFMPIISESTKSQSETFFSSTIKKERLTKEVDICVCFTSTNGLFPKLIAKLQGYTNYYGLIGNYSSLSKFYEHVKRILYKWLNRRSQRRSFNLVEFDACWERYGVPKPRIVESDLEQLHFDF